MSVVGQTLHGDFDDHEERRRLRGGSTQNVVRSSAARGLADRDRHQIGIGSLRHERRDRGTSPNLALNVPGISLGGTYTLRLDTTIASPDVRVSGTGVQLNVFGQPSAALHDRSVTNARAKRSCASASPTAR